MSKEVEHKPIIKDSITGYHLDITEPILLMFIAAIIIFSLIWAAGKKAKEIPGKFQNFIEILIDFIRFDLVDDIIGKEGKPYIAFMITLFLFILVNNLLGLIPGREGATSFIGTTAAWALIVFVLYNYIGIQKQGFVGYIKGIVPSGLPIFIVPIMFILELISHLLRPFTLALRLFANIFAGHQTLLAFTTLAITSNAWIQFLPFSGLVIMYTFEVFVSLIQAYIFTLLTALYINGAVHVEH